MARKKKHEEEEKLERWLVSYADFITLLFAFFTVMYALSLVDQAKYKKAVENIQRAFMSGGGIFPLKGSPFVPFDKPADKGSVIPPSPKDVRGQFSKEQQAAAENVETQLENLYKKTTSLELREGTAEVIPTENGYKIRLGEFLLFKEGSSKLRVEALPFLYEMGKRLAHMNVPIQIEGHSDDVQTKSGEDNWDLSLSRAHNITQFLLVGAEFPKNNVSIAGFADTRPLASNSTPEGRAKNRRVEISVVTTGKKAEELLW